MKPERVLHPVTEEDIVIPVAGARLDGTLAVVQGSPELVLFAHGSGSGRFSARNMYVAQVLQQGGLTTLLFDLLTQAEEAVDLQTERYRFDVGLLSARVIAVTDWLQENPATRGLQVAYFGASTGAAAALVAAAERPEVVRAVVARGGRPDLASAALPGVKAPTLLIVGGRDPFVLDVNRKALERLQTEKKLVVVPGATHLFEEPGALDEVARLAKEWFAKHVARKGGARE
ncbi:MAG: dienelactone hydrolase family protein [Chloroflexi bacterium]|nr:dienelactone hydrolase family protein [Chloroflexota bacterium]MBI4288060.1 dienelactone hydrolase family protein [Chloroflexota bacterium]